MLVIIGTYKNTKNFMTALAAKFPEKLPVQFLKLAETQVLRSGQLYYKNIELWRIVSDHENFSPETLFVAHEPHACCILDDATAHSDYLQEILRSANVLVILPPTNLNNPDECQQVYEALRTGVLTNRPPSIKFAESKLYQIYEGEKTGRLEIRREWLSKHDELTESFKTQIRQTKSARQIQNFYRKYQPRYQAIRQTRKLFKDAFTANEYFLWSLIPGTETVAAARAFFIGAEYIPFSTRSGSFIAIPEQNPNSVYAILIQAPSIPPPPGVTIIHAPWKEQLSRRCFESVLAYQELLASSATRTTQNALDLILSDLKESRAKMNHPVLNLMLQIINQFSAITVQEMREKWFGRTAQEPHRTLFDLTGAAQAVRQKYETSNPLLCHLLVTSLKIWGFALQSDLLLNLARQEVSPAHMKGRAYREESDFPYSNYFGTFRTEDPIPPNHLEFHQALPGGVIRGADFSVPNFALYNEQGFDTIYRRTGSSKPKYLMPSYTQTQFHQGGPSGLTLGLLGSLFEQKDYDSPVCSHISPEEFTDAMKIQMCTLVYAVGGHNFLEMIHVTNLPETERLLQSISIPHYNAIKRDQIFSSFDASHLLEALKTASKYEKWRRGDTTIIF